MKCTTAGDTVLNLLPVVISVTWYLSCALLLQLTKCGANQTMFGRHTVSCYPIWPPSAILDFQRNDILPFRFNFLSGVKFWCKNLVLGSKFGQKWSPIWQLLASWMYFRWRFWSRGILELHLQLPDKFGISPIDLPEIPYSVWLFSNTAVIRHVSFTFWNFWPPTKSSRCPKSLLKCYVHRVLLLFLFISLAWNA